MADPGEVRGDVVRPQVTPPERLVTLLQRKPGKLGAGLGKTTGWIHRAALKMKNVEMISGVNYERIDQGPDGGLALFISQGEKRENWTPSARLTRERDWPQPCKTCKATRHKTLAA